MPLEVQKGREGFLNKEDKNAVTFYSKIWNYVSSTGGMC